MTDTAYLSITYLGPVQYFTKLLTHKNSVIEKYENYSKQSYRNRCNIAGANGRLALVIPVIKANGTKTLIKDMLIDYTEPWQKIHWQSIVSAYRSSPFFEYYENEFSDFYKKQTKYLFDFDMKLMNVILSVLNIETDLKITDNYTFTVSQNSNDFRESISPKKRLDKPDKYFHPAEYHQVFAEKYGFVPNLSCIDLLFNEGTNAASVLKSSLKNTGQK